MTVRHELTTSALTDLLFEEPGVGRCLVAPDGSVLRANAEWLRSTGFDVDQVLGADIVELFPGTRDMAVALHARARAGHRVEVPRHAQVVHGRETWWEGSIAPVPMEGGTGLLIATREVTRGARLPDVTLVRESEERFRLLTEAMPQIVCVLAPDGAAEYVNTAWTRFSGLDAAATARAGWAAIVHADDAAAAFDCRRRVLKQLAPQDVELRYRAADGTYRWFLSRLAPVVANGRVVRLVGAAMDIDARKRAEQALREQERRYRSLFEHSLDAVYLTLADGTVLDANAAACRLHGMTKAEICSLGRAGLVVNDERHAAALRERERTGSTWAEMTVRRKDGTTVPVEVQSVLLDQARPARSEAFVITRDISVRKRADDALRENEQRLRLFIEHAPAAVAMFDARMRYLAVSRRYLRDYGLDERTELTGRSHYEVFPDLPERWKEVHRRCLAGAVEKAEEDPFPRRDGRVDWVRWELHPWTTAAGRIGGLILFSEVITDRKLAQDALLESDRRKSEFLAVLSHELRNPLAPIRNSMVLLERAPADSPQARRAREVIRRQADHLTRLVDDLLDLTRISRGKVELKIQRVDLRDVARKSCDDARTLFERSGVELLFEIGSGPVWIDADPTRIAQVIGNILHNAHKFTPAGGAVTVWLEVEGGAVRVHIKDTGAGLEPGREHSIFEPFVQGDQGIARTKGGLGLGLSLVRSLVELHGGSVAARSEGLGRGAEFVISLPLAAGTGARRRSGEGANVPAREIVLIEDNEDAAETLADVLALDGHRVRIARDGRSGLALAREQPPDVILCDIGLPDIDGYEVARTVRAEPALAGTRLVALTGYAQPEDRERAKEAGFDAHLAKPPSLEALARALGADDR